jgi:hypothetical protein
MTLAPRWALSGIALASDGSDEFAAPGIHLRVMPSPLVGFPLHPFVVFRLPLGEPGSRDGWRFIEWNDPVTGIRHIDASLLDPDESCCLLEVEVDPEQEVDLRVDVLVDGPAGPTVVATRTAFPYRFGGCRITRLRMVGDRFISGIRWWSCDASDFDPGDPILTMGLPVAGGLAYVGHPDAEARAEARVVDGSPSRVSLHDDPADGPTLAVDERSRVAALSSEFDDWIQRVADRTGVQSYVSEPQGRTREWTAAVDPTDGLLTAAFDPGIARWLGLLGIAAAHGSSGHDVGQAFAIMAVFAFRATGADERIDPGRVRLARLAANSSVASPAVAQFPDVLPIAEQLIASGHTVIALTTVVGVADGGEPSAPDRPDAPVVLTPRGGAWRAGTRGDAARRSVTIPLARAPSGMAALTRDAFDGDGLVSLHRIVDPGGNWRSPMVSGRPTRGDLPIVLHDEAAPAGAVQYQVAVADVFGRWSLWTPADAEAGERPPVPIPVPSVTRVPPQPGLPGSGPLAPELLVQIPVPDVSELAPGSFVLTRAIVDITPGVGGSIAVDGSQGQTVDIVVKGPGLDPAQDVEVKVVARFEDAGGRTSSDSRPIVMAVHDPRPPAPVVLRGPLEFAARPGVDGTARVELTWTPAPGQHLYRLFMADEVQLKRRLADAGATALLGQVEAAGDDLGLRAAAYHQHRASLRRDAFHAISRDPVDASTSPARFVHHLPAAFRGLALFRVVPISAALVEGRWDDAPLVCVAVPDDRPAPAPMLRARQRNGSVEISIDPSRGTRPLERARIRRRLRRAASQIADALFMPIVATVDLERGPSPNGPMPTTTWVDPLAVPSDAFLRRTYVAETQGADEPQAADGIVRASPWSTPSNPASVVTVPVDRPPAIAGGSVDGPLFDANLSSRLEILVTHFGDLTSDLEAPYRLDAYRVTDPSAVPQLAASLRADAPVSEGGRTPGSDGPFTLVDRDHAGATVYIIVVVDPLGRTSDPITVPVIDTGPP